MIAATKPLFLSHRFCGHAQSLWFHETVDLLQRKLLGVAIVAPYSNCIVPLLRPPNLRLNVRFQVLDSGRQAADWMKLEVLSPAGLSVSNL
jgi:hypothetical protein